MRVVYFFLIFCLGTTVRLCAIGAIPAMHHFTISEGLPSLEVYCVFQDSRGKIWIGTDVGVSCYDGVSFVNYTKRDNLPDHTIFGIDEDHSGRIWFRSYNGLLSWFDGEKIVQPAVNRILSQKLKGRIVMSQDLDDHDTIWIGLKNEAGWLKIPPGFTQVVEDGRVFNFLTVKEIRKGHLVAAAPRGNYGFLFQSLESAVYKIKEFNGNNWPYAAARISDKRYILQFSYTRYSISSGKITVNVDSTSGRVSFIYPEKDGSYWLCGSQPGGARLMRPGIEKDELIQHYLSNYDVTGCLRDHEGGLWFSTLENGLFYMPFPEMRDVYALPLTTSDHVTAVTSWPAGGVLAGTLRGKFFVAGDGVCSPLDEVINPEGKAINCLSTIGNYVLIGGTGWGGTYDQSTKHFIPLHEQNMVTLKCILAYDQQKWCAASIASLVWINCKTGKTDTLLRQLPERISSIARTRGDTLWLGGFSRLWMLIPGHAPVDWSARYPVLSQPDNLIGDTVSGKLWILSRSSGVFLLSGSGVSEIHTQQPALPVICREMWFVNHSLWLGTNKGVWQLRTLAGRKTTLQNFDRSNGLPANDINHIFVSGNRVWSSGENMLFSFLPGDYPDNKIPPQVCFRKVFCNNVIQQQYAEAAGFCFDENTFHFRLAGQTYKSFGHPVFLVRLLGIDQWHRVEETDITYYNLPPGEYQFIAYALNNSGVRSLIPVRYSFSILPPFWKRNWFIAIIIAVIIFSTWVFVRNYLQRFRREETYRRSMAELEISAIRAQMNPHFIFNAINSIYNFVLTADRKASASYVARFARLIRNVLEFASLKKITLEQELETLRLYMDIEQLRFREAFEYEIQIGSNIHTSSVQIVPMLLQPYIENAIWHGLSPKEGKGKLKITIEKKEEQLTCFIEDNGVGRAQAGSAKQPGIDKEPLSTKLNHRRLELLRDLYGKQFNIEYIDNYLQNGKPSGTTVILSVPQL
ncbi:MAG: histidine kinase [Bacteroidota bacterium]|nr:histidine kinase [Bacteroidota bacterium]